MQVGSCPDGQSRSPYTTHRCLPAHDTHRLSSVQSDADKKHTAITGSTQCTSQEAQAKRTKLLGHALVVLVAEAVRADQRGIGPVYDSCLPARAAS